MTLQEVLLLLAALSYGAATIALYRSIPRGSDASRRLAIVFAIAGALAHGAGLWALGGSGSFAEFDLLDAMSLCSLVVVALLLGSLFLRQPLFDAGLVALPITVAILLVGLAVNLPGGGISASSPKSALHVLSSIMAFGLLSIAGVYALFVTIIDHALQRHELSPVVRALPALDTLQGLLFGLIAAGFGLLSVALATGLLFVDDLFAQHLVHKTVLSILAWLVFGALLVGRWRFGWPGQVAVRLTLVGIVLLLLGYFGSKLVLEVFLGRSWQA